MPFVSSVIVLSYQYVRGTPNAHSLELKLLCVTASPSRKSLLHSPFLTITVFLGCFDLQLLLVFGMSLRHLMCQPRHFWCKLYNTHTSHTHSHHTYAHTSHTCAHTHATHTLHTYACTHTSHTHSSHTHITHITHVHAHIHTLAHTCAHICTHHTHTHTIPSHTT